MVKFSANFLSLIAKFVPTRERITASLFCGIAALMIAPSSASALLAPTTTTVTVSPHPEPLGGSVTFTPTVTGGAGTPDGGVVFVSDGASVVTASLMGSGQATFTPPT